MLCQTCPLYASCTRLCAPAERYVDQDRPGENTRRLRWHSLQSTERQLAAHSYRTWRRHEADHPSLEIDLSCLTATQRLVIECLFHEGLSTRQTARRLGLSQSSLMRKLHRAKAVLRQRTELIQLVVVVPQAAGADDAEVKEEQHVGA